MRTLLVDELRLASAGEGLIITQWISTEGISQECINALLFPAGSSLVYWAYNVVQSCTYAELLILDARQDDADPLTITLA